MAEDKLIPLHLGDSHLLPPLPARRIDLDQASIHRYASVPGLSPLREQIAARLSDRHGIAAERSDIFITPGSTGALSLATEALFDPGDEVIVLTPSWPLIFGILQRRGVKVVEVSVGGDGVPDEPAAFQSRLKSAITPATAGIYFCDPNNPSGFIYSEDFLAPIAATVEEHQLWLLSDLAYLDLAFGIEGSFKPVASRPEFAARCVTAGSYSKTFALAGHRIGYLHAPSAAREPMAKLLTHSTYHASRSAQEMALACLLDGDRDQSVVESYAQGAAIVQSELKAHFHKPQAGAFIFLDLRPLGVASEQDCLGFLNRCLDVGVSLTPGGVFGEDFGPFARLCYTAVSPEKLSEGLDRLNPLFRNT